MFSYNNISLFFKFISLGTLHELSLAVSKKFMKISSQILQVYLCMEFVRKGVLVQGARIGLTILGIGSG